MEFSIQKFTEMLIWKLLQSTFYLSWKLVSTKLTIRLGSINPVQHLALHIISENSMHLCESKTGMRGERVNGIHLL